MNLLLFSSPVGQGAFPPCPLHCLPAFQNDHSKPSLIMNSIVSAFKVYGSFLEVTPYGWPNAREVVRFMIFVNAARRQKRADLSGFIHFVAGRVAAVCCHI